MVAARGSMHPFVGAQFRHLTVEEETRMSPDSMRFIVQAAYSAIVLALSVAVLVLARRNALLLDEVHGLDARRDDELAAARAEWADTLRDVEARHRDELTRMQEARIGEMETVARAAVALSNAADVVGRRR